MFGYCPVERSLKRFVLSPEIDGNVFEVKVSSENLSMGGPLALGSGADAFRLAFNKAIASGRSPRTFDLFREIMNELSVSTVGGFPQVAVANELGVTSKPLLMQSPHNLDVAFLSINGFDLSAANGMDGFEFGFEAVGYDTDKIAGRLALKAKGIDPDGAVISRENKNGASFEAALRAAMHNSIKVKINEVYSLSPPKLIKGTWYFVGTCTNCAVETPICIDPSSGKLGRVFEGPGHLVSKCWLCGRVVTAPVKDIQSVCWDIS